MSDIQSKVTRHAKKQENTTYEEEEKKSTGPKLIETDDRISRQIKTVKTGKRKLVKTKHRKIKRLSEHIPIC